MADNSEMQWEYSMFADIWKLFKKFYRTEADKSFWDDLITAEHEIESKYSSMLCDDLLVAVILELERKHKYIIGDSS